MIAPYMPLAMWAAVGAVPQWYMKAPGTRATNWNESESPGLTLTNARLGAISAAWKSIECNIGESLTSVNSTVSPTVTRTTGPGTTLSKVQASKTTPGATTCSVWTVDIRMRCMRWVDRAGASAVRSPGVRPVPTAASPCDSADGVSLGGSAGRACCDCVAWDPAAGSGSAGCEHATAMASTGSMRITRIGTDPVWVMDYPKVPFPVGWTTRYVSGIDSRSCMERTAT